MQLKENPRNPRKISDQKLKQLAKSLKEFGDLGGIVFNRTTQQLVGGHQRLRALEDVGIEKIEKDDLGHGFVHLKNGERFAYREVDWDENKEKAANIAANKGAGEWDIPKLTEFMVELDIAGFDLDLTMFDEKERKPYLKVSKEGLIDDDEIPEQVESRCKPGDLWLLGNHRLLCGDSTNIQQIETLICGDKIDLVYTDPPYGINEKGNRLSRGRIADARIYKDFKDETIQYAIDAFNICDALKIPRQVWWGANYYCHSIPQTNNWFVWDKRVEEKHKDQNSDCELAWVKSQWSSIRIFRHLWKGIIKGSEQSEARIHPTQKPVELAVWAFDYFKDVKTVLDLFLGSGSTLIACEKTDRICYGMEIDPHYCNVIIERWEKFTGQKALLSVENNGI